MKSKLDSFLLHHRVFLVKHFYQFNGDTLCVKFKYETKYKNCKESPNFSCDILVEIIKLFEKTGSVFKNQEEIEETEECQEIEQIYVKPENPEQDFEDSIQEDSEICSVSISKPQILSNYHEEFETERVLEESQEKSQWCDTYDNNFDLDLKSNLKRKHMGDPDHDYLESGEGSSTSTGLKPAKARKKGKLSTSIKLEGYPFGEDICDAIKCLENKIDHMHRSIKELAKINKELIAECKEMKEKYNDLNGDQGKVSLQLNLFNKYIEGTRAYFPIENLEKLIELEEKIMEKKIVKAAVETELRRIIKEGDNDFLSKIAKPEILAGFNVTGRGKRQNILDFHVFKYSSEIMKLKRSELRTLVERQQARIRQRMKRGHKRNRLSMEKVILEKPVAPDSEKYSEQSSPNISPENIMLP